jgi:hypothetical protein
MPRIFAVASWKRSHGVLVMGSTLAQPEIKVTPMMLRLALLFFWTQ